MNKWSYRPTPEMSFQVVDRAKFSFLAFHLLTTKKEKCKTHIEIFKFVARSGSKGI